MESTIEMPLNLYEEMVAKCFITNSLLLMEDNIDIEFIKYLINNYKKTLKEKNNESKRNV